MKSLYNSFRFRIISVTVLSVALVQILSNIYIFYTMNKQLDQKNNEISENLLSVIESDIIKQISDLSQVVFLIEEDWNVSASMALTDIDTTSAKQTAIKAQDMLDSYLHTITSSAYVRKLVIFNESDVMIQSTVAQFSGQSSDLLAIQNSPQYSELRSIYDNPTLEKSFYQLSPSINGQQSAFCVLHTINATDNQKATLYLEVSSDIFLDVLELYLNSNLLFAVLESGEVLCSCLEFPTGAVQSETFDGNTLVYQDIEYNLVSRTIPSLGLTIYAGTDVATTQLTHNQTAKIILETIIISTLLSSFLVYITSIHFTRSIHHLILKIKQIGNNDFSYDPSIEQSNDEIAEIGKVVNEMALSFRNLLDAVIRDSEERKRIEFALLQSQVNPHFLYNTLDSIRWMADIQGHEGIVSISQSLINLLKNMAKGANETITLSQELSLLSDYINIQSIRYLESFQVKYDIPAQYNDCRIIKMVLQPIVENAIFHGVQPSGRLGTITVRARESNDGWLIITIHDNGVGMTSPEIEQLLSKGQGSSNSLATGIGVSNVHKRLRMLYGANSGITIQSEKNVYTEMTIRIPIERDLDVQNITN
ncbi:MAG: histidine kinase [Faecalibacterium sp.]